MLFNEANVSTMKEVIALQMSGEAPASRALVIIIIIIIIIIILLMIIMMMIIMIIIVILTLIIAIIPITVILIIMILSLVSIYHYHFPAEVLLRRTYDDNDNEAEDLLNSSQGKWPIY